MAEAHPVGFQWVMEAKARGAKIIHVDPVHLHQRGGGRSCRCARAATSRSSAASSTTSCRTSSTSASTSWRTPTPRRSSVTSSRTPTTSTGCSPASTRRRAPTTPARGSTPARRAGQREQGGPAPGPGDRVRHAARVARHRRAGSPPARRDAPAPELRLPDPQAALLALHPRDGGAHLRGLGGGVPRGLRGLGQNSGREKTTALVYSVGWTQHSVGVPQYIRTGAILQLLLGNMGRPGGGIMALRGTPASRGPPTSRRCSTSSRATCRCPTRPTTRRCSSGWTASGTRARRVLDQRDVRGQPAQGLLGRRGHGRTTTASTTCPSSPATTAPTGPCST